MKITHRNLIRTVALAIVLALASSSRLWAGTVTWAGADATDSTAWSAAANWDAGVPGSGDDVVFSATGVGRVDLGGAEITVNTVTFTHGSGTYVLTNGTLRCASTATDAFNTTAAGFVNVYATLGAPGDAFGVRQSGGNLTLYSGNNFSGGLGINANTVFLPENGAQGTGPITFTASGKSVSFSGSWIPLRDVDSPITVFPTGTDKIFFGSFTTGYGNSRYSGALTLGNYNGDTEINSVGLLKIEGPVTTAQSGRSYLKFGMGGNVYSANLGCLWDPASVTEHPGVITRMSVVGDSSTRPANGATLIVRDVDKLFTGRLVLQYGILLLDGISWSEFSANRSGGYGTTDSAGCRMWNFSGTQPSGFAAATQPLIIGTAGERLPSYFDHDLFLSSSAVDFDGQVLANANTVLRGNLELTANRTLVAGGSGPWLSPIAPGTNSFAVVEGNLSGTGVVPYTKTVYTPEGRMGELVLAGTNDWTGVSCVTNSTYVFSAGPGGLMPLANAESFVRFVGNDSLPRGNGGATAYLASLRNQSGGIQMTHGYLLTSTPEGETYELPTGYRFVVGGWSNRARGGLVGASSHDGVAGSATLRNSDLCLHATSLNTTDSATVEPCGLLVRDGVFTLGEPGAPVRVIPVQSDGSATAPAASTLLDDTLRTTHGFVKYGEGTLVLGNLQYTTLDHAGDTKSMFSGWALGRAIDTVAPNTGLNQGSNSYFDGAVRGLAPNDPAGGPSNSLFFAGSAFPVYLAGGVYEVDANGADPATFEATIGSNPGNVFWPYQKVWNNNNNTVYRGGGGFSAYGGDLNVDLDGSSQEWQQGGFVGLNAPLIFGSHTATHDVTWLDALGLANADDETVEREIRVIAQAVDFAAGIRNRGNGAAGGTGTRSLLKTGNGTLVLSSDVCDYNGTTTVQAGTLAVNGTLTADGGDVIVQNTAVLGGTGTVGRVTYVQNGGTIAPGCSVGTLTLTNNVTFEVGGALSWEFASDSAGGSDVAVVEGLLTFDGTWTLRLVQLGSAVPAQRQYVLFDAKGGVSGFDPENITVDAASAELSSAYAVMQVGDQIVLKRIYPSTAIIVIR